MDITQSVLLSVIVVITVFLVIVGFQVFFVLKDFRKTLKRANKLFDSAEELVVDVKRPIESAGNIFTALIAGAGISRLIKKVEKNERETK